jgi:predicted ArsR family transcriptional regulator
MAEPNAVDQVAAAPVPLERDVFLRSLVRELAGTLEEVIGVDEASGFVSVVGQRIGEQIDADYRAALGVERLSRPQVVAVLADLKRRIQGDFRLVEQDEERFVYENSACPFAEKVLGRPSMCMMTSNVFGTIAAQNLGQAKVSLERTIAQGARGCRVVVYTGRTPESEAAPGREYFRA